MDVVPKSRSAGRNDVGHQEERLWGNWHAVHVAASYIMKRAESKPEHRLSLQFHKHHSERRGIVAGRGEPTVDDGKIGVAPADVVISCGALHRTHNAGEDVLVFVEVRLGELPDDSDFTWLDHDNARD